MSRKGKATPYLSQGEKGCSISDLSSERWCRRN